MSDSKSTYIINHGPYFRGSRSTVGLFFSIVSVIALLYTGSLLINGLFLLALLPFLLIACCLVVGISVFLGVEGVEFDFKRKRARYYRKYLGKKFGMWTPLEQYNVLTLDMESFSYTASSPTGHRQGKHRTFDVYLEGEKPEFDLYLAECMNYQEGQRTLIRLSKELGFPMNDVFQDKLKKAPKRRRR